MLLFGAAYSALTRDNKNQDRNMTMKESKSVAQAPIPGMTLDEAPALRAERDGRTFYFCGEHRQKTFLSTLVQSMAERGRSGDGL